MIFKGFREGMLILKPEEKGNHRDGIIGFREQLSRFLQFALDQKLFWRQTKGLAERARQVIRMNAEVFCHLGDGEFLGVFRLQIALDPDCQ